MSEEEKKVIVVGSSPIRGYGKSRSLGLALAALIASEAGSSFNIPVQRIKPKHPKIRRVPAATYRQAKVFFVAETEQDLKALKAAEEKRARKAAKLARSQK